MGLCLTNDFPLTSMLLVFSGVFTFLVDAYPVYAASALAANSFARSSFAAAFPLFGVQSRFEMTGDTKEAKHVWLTAADGCVHGSVSPAGLPMGDDPARLRDGGDGPLPVSGSSTAGRHLSSSAVATWLTRRQVHILQAWQKDTRCQSICRGPIGRFFVIVFWLHVPV